MKKKSLIAFFIVFILAVIPRFIIVFANRPFTDEAGFDLLVAKNIVVNHIFPLAGFNLNYSWHITKGPGWYYTLAIPVFFGNGNPIIAKIFMSLCQLSAIILAFFSLKKFFNLKTAFFATFLLSISPWFLDQSALIWPPFMAPLAIVFFLASLMYFLRGNKTAFLFVTFAIGLIAQYEIAIAIFLIPQVILFSVFWLRKGLINIKFIIFSILTFLLTMIPVIIYEVTHNFYSTRGLFILLNELLRGGGELNFSSKILQRIDTFTWGFRSTFAPNVFVSFAIFIVLVYFAYYFLKNKKNPIWAKRFLIFLIAAPFLKFIFSIFYPGVAMAWHYLDLIIIYCFTAGILFGSVDNRKIKYLTYFLCFVLFILFSVRTNDVYKNEYHFSFSPDNIRQSVVVRYVYEDSKGKAFKYKVLSLSPLTTDFDYLFWYYGKDVGVKNFNSGKITYIIKQEANPKIQTNKKGFKEFPGYTVEKLESIN